MNQLLVQTLIKDGLWVMIFSGWIFLILVGLEADKPQSGGLPGHVTAEDHHTVAENRWDRVGEVGSWLTFGLAACCLLIALWWIA